MNLLHRHILPWIKVIISQALSFYVIQFILGTEPFSLIISLILQGLLAAIIGKVLKLSLFWIPIQILLPIAIIYSGTIPSWSYIIAFILCGLIYWNSAHEQVPLYLTNLKTWQALNRFSIKVNAKSFIDLGSGTGGGVIYIAKNNINIEAFGIETAPLVFLLAKLRTIFTNNKNAKIIYKSIWDEDLASYDVVYCFLSPVPMPRLFEKAKQEMRTGTYFISNSFTVPNKEPDEIMEISDSRKTKLHIWQM